MRAPDWQHILSSEGIDFITSGPSVTRGNIAIKCPWCGPEDPSHHMGISLSGEGWHCWRNHEHRGRSPVRLLFKLLGDRATKYLPRVVPEEVASVQAKGAPSRFVLLTESAAAVQDYEDQWHNFDRIPWDGLVGQYCQSRRIDQHSAVLHDLRWSAYGRFAWRVLFPIRWNGALMGWTGRAVGDRSPRYLTTETDSIGGVWLPSSAELIIIVEGMMDAVLLAQGIRRARSSRLGVVAGLGTSWSPRKFEQLKSLGKPLAVVFDSDAFIQGLRAAMGLSCSVLTLPAGVKDFGECTTEEIVKWIRTKEQSS